MDSAVETDVAIGCAIAMQGLSAIRKEAVTNGIRCLFRMGFSFDRWLAG